MRRTLDSFTIKSSCSQLLFSIADGTQIRRHNTENKGAMGRVIACRCLVAPLALGLSLLLCLPTATTQQQDIPILVLLPGQAPNKYIFPFGLEMCGAAVFSAIDDIHRNQILPGYRIVADMKNSACNAIKGIGLAYDNLHLRNYTAIIGPACSEVCKMVARLASYLNVPCFSSVCQDIEMQDKSHFQTLTRFQGTFEMTGSAVGSILQYFGWNIVGIIAERQVDIIWLHTRRGLHYAFERMNITIAMSTLMEGDTGLENYLLETAKVSRVIILPMLGKTLRKALLFAHKHGLNNGDYIFISVTYYDQRAKFGYYGWDYGDEDDVKVREMFQSLFFISYYVRSENDALRDFSSYVKNGSAVRWNYHYGQDEEVPYPAANLYEAVTVFAQALNETLAEGGNIRDGRLVARRLWGRDFPSLTGGLRLNEQGDRVQAYMIKHMQDIEAGKIPVIANYFSNNKHLELLTERIIWPGGRTTPPPDTPPCGFEGELCIEDPYAQLIRIVAIFSGVLVSTFIVATIIIVFVYKRMKWEKAIADRKWKILHDDVVEEKGLGMSRSIKSTMSLKTIESNMSAIQRFAQTGVYKGIRVAIKTITHVKEVDMGNREFLYEMKMLYDLTHHNLVKFVGASIEMPKIRIYTEYCMKGGLQDVLENTEITLDWTFKCSLMLDILEGLIFIQDSFLKYHGNLTSSACLVDGRFVVKLTNFGIRQWRKNPEKPDKDYLWTSPECLLPGPGNGSAKGDVYSFSIILQEITLREGPFYVENPDITTEAIIENVKRGSRPPFRPTTEGMDCPAGIQELMARCWAEDPLDRPTVQEVKALIKEASGLKGQNLNIMDNLLQRMEQYANNLEGLVEERTGKYLEEKKRAEDLLHRLLPQSVADELQLRGTVDPVTYDSVTIYFSDIVAFTPICSSSTPIQVVNLLNDLYTLFDSIIARYDVYKVETIGDAYMTVSGLPKTNGNRHVREICLMALALLDSVKTFKIRHKPDTTLLLRIGLHTGSCVTGVVGLTMPRYCLFGDTVNTASRMESNGEALKIHMSPDTKEALEQHPGFNVASRGVMFIKGKGDMETFWLIDGPEKKKKKKDRHGNHAPATVGDPANGHPFGTEP